MTEAEGRMAVVRAARSWIGTPYHHAARVKGVGVDCAMLLAAAYEEAGLVSPIAFERYSPGWMLHRDAERLLAVIETRTWPAQEPGAPGDLLVYRFGRAFAHGAIVVEWPVIIHAVQRAGVILDKVDGAQLRGRERKLFSLFPQSPGPQSRPG
ncbi:MAG TPA: NlpC/P60 family protein [Alphaproteobacteria bacterium]|nr:NlpC/P60 family protein [Alphaproteobacteria bacterium]